MPASRAAHPSRVRVSRQGGGGAGAQHPWRVTVSGTAAVTETGSTTAAMIAIVTAAAAQAGTRRGIAKVIVGVKHPVGVSSVIVSCSMRCAACHSVALPRFSGPVSSVCCSLLKASCLDAVC